MTTRKVTVKELQLRLLAAGESLPRFGADGKGGSETLAALNSYKRKRGLPADGKLDKVTHRLLFGVPPKPSPLTKFFLFLVERQLKETNMWKMLEGKKTYIATAVAALAIVVNHFFGPLPGIELDPDQWLVQLGALVFPVTIRSAIPDKSKVENGGTK